MATFTAIALDRLLEPASFSSCNSTILKLPPTPAHTDSVEGNDITGNGIAARVGDVLLNSDEAQRVLGEGRDDDFLDSMSSVSNFDDDGYGIEPLQTPTTPVEEYYTA